MLDKFHTKIKKKKYRKNKMPNLTNKSTAIVLYKLFLYLFFGQFINDTDSTVRHRLIEFKLNFLCISA